MAEFIQLASATVPYRLTGKVSDFTTGKNSIGEDWMQFNLVDASGSILVYGFNDGQFEEWSTKIKDNGTVVLHGTYQKYTTRHEVMNAVIESFMD